MAEFTPDNPLLAMNTKGVFTDAQRDALLEDFMSDSKLTRVGNFKQMQGKEDLKFVYQSEGPGAYWVGEAERIQTTTAKWLNATMKSYKIATILPVSNEWLNYRMSDIFEAMKPQIVSAINRKVDEAVFLGVDTPFDKNVLTVAKANAKSVVGDITGANIDDLVYGLAESGIAVSHFITGIKSLRMLNKAYEDVSGAGANAVASKLYDKANQTLDGVPVVQLDKRSAIEAGTLIAGDFDYLYYGISRDFEYKMTDSAQLSTVSYKDGKPLNLFEQDMVAMRVTFQIGSLIAKEDAFAAITPTPEP